MKKKVLYSSIAALMVLPALSVAAEEPDEKMKTMEEVVVTATRTPKDINTVPANVTVITADEIVDSGASSIVDVLESQANIHIRTFSGNASQAQIDLRGFGENGFGRTLVMLDGRRLNRLDMSSVNWTQLPLDQIERIEVVRGSSSVLYGDAAVAGVIHIITKKGSVEPTMTVSLKVGEDGFHDESAGVLGSSDKFSYSASAANQQTDGWRDRTTFQSYGGGVQLGYDFSDNFSISGGGSYNKADFEMPGPLTEIELAQDRTQTGAAYKNDEAENEFQNANLLLEASMGKLGDIELNLVYGISKIISTYGFFGSYNNIETKSFGIQPKYIFEADFGNISNQIITGFDIYYENIDVDKFSDAARLNKTHESKLGRDTVGWYIRDEVSFANSFILSGGARVERAEIFGKSLTVSPFAVVYDETKDHDGEVFELGATWLPNEKIRLYAKYATVYRYPFTDEQATYYGSPWSPDYFDPDIEAEEGQSLETGFELNPNKDFSLGLSLFQIDMEDEISLNSFYVNENMDDTRHRGMELFLEYKLQEFYTLGIHYTFQESTFESGLNNGNDIPLVPNNILTASLDLSLPYALHLIPSVLYVDDAYLSGDLDNNAVKLDDYTVIDLLLRYRKNFGKTQLTAFLGVNNLFNDEYSNFGGDWGTPKYYPSPGRKFYGGISGTF